jgi:hypothetical protein
MKITDLLLENLGNLSQLNAGPLVNVLRQYVTGTFRRSYGGDAGPEQKKFQHPMIGSESEIVDVGAIKDLAGLRKQYKQNEGPSLNDGRNPQGFGLYINGKCIAIGVFDSDKLGGSSRIGLLAWDVSAFGEQFQYTKAASRSEKIARWNNNKIEKSEGVAVDTGSLKNYVEHFAKLAAANNSQLTAKLIMQDQNRSEKILQRLNLRHTKGEIYTGADALKKRLKSYKLSKNPTADTIQQFIATALAQATGKLRFGDLTYNLASSGQAMDPMAALRGQPFTREYKAEDPERSYSSMEITYYFDAKEGEIKPISAKWAASKTGYGSQLEILDPAVYAKMTYKINDITDKQTVIPKILQSLKDGKLSVVDQLLSIAEKANPDWPELAVIKKSIAADRASKAANNPANQQV